MSFLINFFTVIIFIKLSNKFFIILLNFELIFSVLALFSKIFNCHLGGGSTLIFTSWSYFIEFYLSYQTFLTAWKNLKKNSRYERSKLVTSIGSLWKAQTKNAKIDHFTKNLSPPSFFNQSSSNFHKKCIVKF